MITNKAFWLYYFAAQNLNEHEYAMSNTCKPNISISQLKIIATSTQYHIIIIIKKISAFKIMKIKTFPNNI